MTKVKFCGLRRPEDIAAANRLQPDYIGFVFAAASRRCISSDTAAALRAQLAPGITAVGVFVDAAPSAVAALLQRGVIDMAQLHGHEDAAYIVRLRALSPQPILQAFRIRTESDVQRANASCADWVLLDAGAGQGERFDWQLLSGVTRPYFLAGGLSPDNIAAAIAQWHPWAVDVSSGIESDGLKDERKMIRFMEQIRREEP